MRHSIKDRLIMLFFASVTLLLMASFVAAISVSHAQAYAIISK
jgi:hypothetical protein